MSRPGAKWYVYHLVDPRDGAVFYVGKGCGRRVAAHESDARLRPADMAPRLERIREIWAAGHNVERRIVAQFWDERAAFDFEHREISATNGCLNIIGADHVGERRPGTFTGIFRWMLGAFMDNDRAEMETARPYVESALRRFVKAGNANGIEICGKLLEAYETHDPMRCFNDYLDSFVPETICR